MTNSVEPVPDGIAYVRQLRHRTRVARDGSWFVLLVFGAVVLLAMFFYRGLALSSTSPGCQPFSHGFVCTVMWHTRGIFGSGLGTSYPLGDAASAWATTYWVVALTLAILAIVAFYWARARASGVVGRVWPFATVSLVVLILALVSRGWFIAHIPADFWIRGMQALFVIALGLAALAALERTWPFAVFVGGFVGLAFLSSLYDVDNLFAHVGLASNWGAGDQLLPNLLVPGAYLLVGSAAFYLARRSHYQYFVGRRRVDDGQ